MATTSKSRSTKRAKTSKKSKKKRGNRTASSSSKRVRPGNLTTVSTEERLSELMMMGLRLTEGVTRDAVLRETGEEIVRVA